MKLTSEEIQYLQELLNREGDLDNEILNDKESPLDEVETAKKSMKNVGNLLLKLHYEKSEG